MAEAPKVDRPNVFKRPGGPWTVIGLLLVGGIIGLSVMQWTAKDPVLEPDPDYTAPRHLIVISIDTLRADRLGTHGYKRKTSPTMDALAKEGVLFENHYVNYPLTLPAHLTQLTGVTTLGHRVRDNLYHRLPDEYATLPEVMKAQGFATGAFVSAHTMKAGSGLERGFDVYDDKDVRELTPGKLTITERKAPQTLQLAGDWIAERGSDRFFCYIHLFDPHAPYEEHADLGAEFTGDNNARYDGEIAYTDLAIGRFVRRLLELNLLEDSLLVITSDHGEGLGDHNELTHGYYCYDTCTHVPLIIRGAPNVQAGSRVGTLVRNYDLAPTLIELMGLKETEQGKRILNQAHGVSLLPAMLQPDVDLGLSAYIESHYAWLNANWAKLRGIRTQETLTLFAGSEVVHYRDKLQTTNVAEDHGTDVAAARTEIERLMSAWTPPRKDALSVRESTIGTPYPGESPVAQSFEPESLNDTRDLPSPHARADVLRAYQEAELDYDAGHFHLCADRLRVLLAANPDFGMARKLLAAVLTGIVRAEHENLDDSRGLIREAADNLVVAARVARDNGQELSATSIERNLALLLVWLNDVPALEVLTDLDDPAVRWMHAMARYRKATSDDTRRAAIDHAREVLAAAGSAGFVESARRDLARMEALEPLRLAPWEQ